METSSGYDLVLWDSTLHNMPDKRRAIETSFSCLRRWGLFVMNDFIGPDRFQWTDRQLHYASAVRGKLPQRLLRHPAVADKFIPPYAQRPSVAGMIALDSSEASDSSQILNGIGRSLADPSIWLLGGAIYHIALNDVLSNIDIDQDACLLDMLLLLDETLSSLRENLYEACISRRP